MGGAESSDWKILIMRMMYCYRIFSECDEGNNNAWYATKMLIAVVNFVQTTITMNFV
jgi:hypothetical protein